MSEQTKTGHARPEIKGKVIAVLDEWRNSSGTFCKREVVVETGLRYPNPLKVTFKNDAISHLEGVAEGDCVAIPYALDGRRWDGPNGVQYFNDIVGLSLRKICGTSAPADAKPIIGCTATTAVETWEKYHGDDKAGFVEFCKAQKPGKASKAYTISDWADIVNAIEAAQNPAAETDDEGATDFDDLPF